MKPPLYTFLIAVLVGALTAGSALVAQADTPSLSTEWCLPGDAVFRTPVDTQDFSRVAPGGSGYLVVWEDERPVLSGWSSTDQPLAGNSIDIYAARLDASGQLLDPAPIVITQYGWSQTKPQVAWNEAAGAWLVVWVAERPDWYFYTDIVAARVAADGTLLDPAPIVLRPENPSPANDYARFPTVTSDGQNWIVAWEDQIWVNDQPRSNLAGKRVGPTGAVLDPSPVVLYQHPDSVFGPIMPHLAWAGDECLLVWERAGYYDLYGRLIDANLAPLAPQFLITTTGYGPRVATNGVDFLVVSRFASVHRVTHAGVSLDPAGIALDVYPTSEYRGPDVAWNGTHWVVACSSPRPYPLREAIFLSRITTAGALVGASTALWPDDGGQHLPSIASSGGGTAQVLWTQRDAASGALGDIRGTNVNVNGVPASNEAISMGWARQQRVRFATQGSEHLAVYLSESGGMSRILAQRLSTLGTPIDAEPVEIAAEPNEMGSATALAGIRPDVASNGSMYVVSWCTNGTVFARRLALDLTFLDPAPVALVNDAANTVGVGALGGNFLLAYTHIFSGDQHSLKGLVVRGSDLSVLSGPVTIGGDFVDMFPQVRALGTRWLVVWVHRPTHDSPASAVNAAFVDAAGTPTAPVVVSGAGYGFEHDVAVGNGRALITWADNGAYVDAQIEARLLNADGSFLGSDFIVCDVPKHQRFTSCGWDGSGFVAAWTDFRGLGQVEQLRGDIFAARIGWDGVVQDPGGFQVSAGPLPEDLPAVTGGGGVPLIAYCRLEGSRDAEVQRIAYRTVGTAATDVVVVAPGARQLRAEPNPFRGTIAFAFAGSQEAPTHLEIFGVDGRRVRSFELAAGVRELVWDGRDEQGHGVPAGVYFARVRQGAEAWPTSRVVRIR